MTSKWPVINDGYRIEKKGCVNSGCTSLLGLWGLLLNRVFVAQVSFYAFMPRDAGNTDRKIDQNRLLINLIKKP